MGDAEIVLLTTEGQTPTPLPVMGSVAGGQAIGLSIRKSKWVALLNSPYLGVAAKDMSFLSLLSSDQ